MTKLYQNISKTSWQHVGKWYGAIVGSSGHYFHKHVIMPGLWKLLKLDSKSSILDLACGNGVLAHNIPKNIYYQGIDIAQSLINIAKKTDNSPNHYYQIGDITKPLNISKFDFTHTTIILALQNIEHIKQVFRNANNHLVDDGKFVIVINHPYFRIPKQTSWGNDEVNKIQYRRVNRYLSPLKIPITAHPGKKNDTDVTWSFHYPLSTYSQELFASGFVIQRIEEWVSDKVSVGPAAKMENTARQEFPLFMAILARKAIGC
ncbi:class I SAM-dependent methyltransferase [Candidatus Gottesmanbacteria bacterium]|nr:class I SAM-dependent methyltransferase [Candidatus Gottesmanbacteria bacterium]